MYTDLEREKGGKKTFRKALKAISSLKSLECKILIAKPKFMLTCRVIS